LNRSPQRDVTRSPIRGTFSSCSHSPDGREHHRPDRIELRIGREHLAVLVEDLDELAEVRVLPVPAGVLSLLEYRVDRLLSARQIRDGRAPAS
jgi:hypothetical protein